MFLVADGKMEVFAGDLSGRAGDFYSAAERVNTVTMGRINLQVFQWKDGRQQKQLNGRSHSPGGVPLTARGVHRD
jgi:hypothetical protein